MWNVAGLLGALGVMKLVTPRDKLAKKFGWVDDLAPIYVKVIGTLEVLAAIGLIAPAVAGVATVLVPIASLGLVILVIGGVYVHARKGELSMTAPNVVLAVLAAVVVWGRVGPFSF